MKKSIVLLITLMFIASLSALILKNLNDTEIFIREQNSKIDKVQMLSLIQDIQNSVSKKIKDIDDCTYIQSRFKDFRLIPLNNGLNIKFKLECYDKININDLNSSDKKVLEEVVKKLNDLEIFDIDNLRYLLKGQEKIDSQKKLNFILKEFSKQVYNNKILEQKEEIGFLDKTKVRFELKIRVNEQTKAYYILDKDGKVEYFELSFK